MARKASAGGSRLIQWVYSLSLKQRIWFAFVFLITCSLLSMGSIAYLIAAKEIQRNAFQSSQDTVNQSAKIVNERLKNIGIAVRGLMFSDAFKRVLTDVQNADATRYYQSLTSLQPVFSQVKFNDMMIDSILIATPYGDYYPTSSARNMGNSFYQSDMYDQFRQQKRGFWTKGHVDPFFTDKERVISLVVEGVNDTGETATDVFVVVNVKEADLFELFLQNLSHTNTSYLFIDAEGKNIGSQPGAAVDSWSAQPEFLRQLSADMTGAFFYSNDDKDYLVNYARLDIKEEWMIVGIQSKDDLLARLNGIQRATSYVMIGFILLSLLLSNTLTQLLLKPLSHLQKLMKRVEDNDLDVRFESVYKDEVSQVGFRFNRMLDEIKQLIDDVKNRERDKRRAEIKALSAQMDPHFFYNTLNTIYCKSVLGENGDVNEMILALSRMFQLSLSGGRDMITIQEELDHVRQYLAIQHKSYEDLFVCSIEAEPEAEACLVPKIMIQPLVENSIHHGFQDRSSGGEISLQVRVSGTWLHITVQDNGQGLNPDQLMQEIAAPTTHANKGYALRNIYHRLQLYFGEQQRMAISHSDTGGACIELWLPRMTGGDHIYEPTA
jgi:two-component system, sensor histidine kinase YesM